MDVPVTYPKLDEPIFRQSVADGLDQTPITSPPEGPARGAAWSVTVPVDCKSRSMILIRSFLFRTWNQPRVGLTDRRRRLRGLRDAGKRTVKILGQDIGEARCPGELMQGGIESNWTALDRIYGG